MPEQMSIQNFYEREIRPPRVASDSAAHADLQTSDGFTADEINAVIHPAGLPPWQPRDDYPEQDIADVEPGPGRIAVTGRIVNLYHQPRARAAAAGPRGFWRLCIKDDTGAIVVRIRAAFDHSPSPRPAPLPSSF